MTYHHSPCTLLRRPRIWITLPAGSSTSAVAPATGRGSTAALTVSRVPSLEGDAPGAGVLGITGAAGVITGAWVIMGGTGAGNAAAGVRGCALSGAGVNGEGLAGAGGSTAEVSASLAISVVGSETSGASSSAGMRAQALSRSNALAATCRGFTVFMSFSSAPAVRRATLSVVII